MQQEIVKEIEEPFLGPFCTCLSALLALWPHYAEIPSTCLEDEGVFSSSDNYLMDFMRD